MAIHWQRRIGTRLGGIAAEIWATLQAVAAGDRDLDGMPDRVRARLVAQQDNSEIIIGWMQVAAIVTFASLYSLTPKAFPPSVPFEPVPWTLGIYGLFTAWRLVLAHQGRLRGGMLHLSVVIDMAVLMVTIWSFHLQYQAPPALYLKAPTLMYVFILIALRALRFDPHYVILAGLTAAGGWLLLVAYAVAFAENAMPVTRNFATYAMSYSILLGAEFDKVISMLAVTGILAFTLVRTRRLLVAAIADNIAAADLARFFAPEVAAQIRGSAGEVMTFSGHRRQAAVLTLDLRGFTKLSRQLAPDELMAVLREYQDRVVPIIQRHGGSIDKYLGDGILSSFGAVSPSATHAADGLRALVEVMAAAAEWSRTRAAQGLPAPAVGGALAAGEVVFGIIGHESRLEYTVIGDTVNLAAKLEKHTKAEGVAALTTAATWDLARQQGYEAGARPPARPQRRVEGVADPVDLVVVA
jgi:adenylate cyclase